ncbi:MAG: hypothetical protein JWL86_1321 [Rhizobium sp.]|nr:hypothetical protein [Rhizobium sp.]
MIAPRLLDYLGHIEQAAAEALDFVSAYDEDSFKADRKTQQAAIMNLIIIGEASARILQSFPEFTEGHSEIAWNQMRGMRNRITHGYTDINLDTVWDTLRTSIPILLEQIRQIPKS